MLSERLQATAWWLYNMDFTINTDPCHEWTEDDHLDFAASVYCSEVLGTELMLMSYPAA